MKKIIYSILAIALVFSCQDQDDHGVTVNDYNGTTPVVYYTNGVSGSYFVTPTATPFTIQVGATTTSTVDRTFTIEADASSTAQAGVDYDFVSTSIRDSIHYSITSNHIVIRPTKGHVGKFLGRL